MSDNDWTNLNAQIVCKQPGLSTWLLCKNDIIKLFPVIQLDVINTFSDAYYAMVLVLYSLTRYSVLVLRTDYSRFHS